MINDVKPEQVFWLKNGKQLKNVAELGRELKNMPQEVFTHHVNTSKNDFSSWIEFCVKDKQLAQLVKTTRDPKRMAAIIERRIKQATTPPRMPTTPSIVRTKNVTLLNLAHKPNVIKTKKTTPLIITQKPKIITTKKTTPLIISHKSKPKTEHKKTVIRGKNKTLLKLYPPLEVFFLEIKPHHYSITTIASLISFGIVTGAAIAILIMALG